MRPPAEQPAWRQLGTGCLAAPAGPVCQPASGRLPASPPAPCRAPHPATGPPALPPLASPPQAAPSRYLPREFVTVDRGLQALLVEGLVQRGEAQVQASGGAGPACVPPSWGACAAARLLLPACC